MVFLGTPSNPNADRLLQIVGVNEETVTDVSSKDYPGHWPYEDHSWNKEKFKEAFEVRFYKNELLDASFSLIGIDASIANALRRILIAEIPTLAVEYVYVYNNTSIIQDEVLAARLGLIPLKGGKDGLRNFLQWYPKPAEGTVHGEEKATDHNTIRFDLNIECLRNENAPKGELDPRKLYHNAHVYAKDMKFNPWGQQEKHFSGDDVLGPTNPDILIAKLRPGQCIDVRMHAIKGIGSDHAKFSPVATASYRLLPTITITEPILGKDAEKFSKCFPQGVIEIETVTEADVAKVGSGYEGHAGEKKAVVKDAMKDTVSRECLRHKEFEGKVKLGRVRDHFIFSVESVGQWDSDEMFVEAIKVLKTKCQVLKKNLANMAR